MKIAYLIYSTFNSGGMERILSTKANYLARDGNQITIITTDQQGRKPFFDFNPLIKHIDLDINLSQTNGQSFVKKLIHYIAKQRRYKKRLKAFLFRENFDVVVSMFCGEVHWLPRINDGSKKVAEIHFSKFFRMQQARGGMWKMADRYRMKKDEKVISKYDKFIVLTHEDKGYWVQNDNVIVIPNACHIDHIEPAKLDNKQAVAVGRLTFQKGYNYMIDAWKLVHNTHPDWILNIYGGGEDKDELLKQINNCGLNNNVIINAPQSNIETKIVEHSIYLLSSRYEGLPMVLLESMACGVPCVSFECKCGPRDVVCDGQDGFITPYENIEAMAEKICTLIENEELRKQMGINAVKKVSDKFSVEVVMQQWVKLFESLVKNKTT